MDNDQRWRLFNIDSIFEGINAPLPDASIIDLYVASLSFRNFDFVEHRLPFLRENVTCDIETWSRLVASAPLKYWIKSKNEGVVVYLQTDLCGCLRSYRYRGVFSSIKTMATGWINLSDTQALCHSLDSPAARSIYDAWSQWMTTTNSEATALAKGRFSNTTVGRSLIFSGVGRCLACSSPAVSSARTTITSAPGSSGTLIQLPLCLEHLEQAKQQPNVLKFMSMLFSMSLDIPDFGRSESIPDELIPQLHSMVAEELGGISTIAENRDNGWHLTIQLPSGWRWLLRLKSLTDYSYMLFSPSEKKQVYRADSASHHHDLPFSPDHEHSRPGRNSDVCSPSFLYGNPFFDFKRLREVGEQRMGEL